MDRKTQWLSLIAGCLLMIYGVRRLIVADEWLLIILSALIIAFTASSMMKSRGK